MCPFLILETTSIAESDFQGAIYSVVSFFACVYPKATFLIFGIVPCPAWAFVGGIFAYDMYRSLAHSVSMGVIGHCASYF
jgi:rhomboid-like protein